MRFAKMMAAMAALWVHPAAAVEITLTSPTPGALTHQKVTLSGLTGADTITASAFTGSFNSYWWENFGSGWSLGGNGGNDLNCVTGSSGTCHEELNVSSLKYPVSLSALVDIKIVGSEIFIDWFKSPDAMLCPSIPENQRIPSFGNNKCGFAWYSQYPSSILKLGFDVAGPSAQTFSYSVTNLTPANPVPEPSSWMLTILGVGMIGVALRRRYQIPDGLLGTVVP